MRKIPFLILLLLVAISVWAQPDPNRPQPDGERPNNGQRLQALVNALTNLRPQTVVKATPSGVLVLRNGVLAKYDGVSAKPRKVVELYGPLPTPPANDAPVEDTQRYTLDVARRLFPAVVLLQDNDILVVTSDHFFRFDYNTLTLKSDIPLAIDIARDRAALLQPPAVDVNDQTVYIARGNTLTALNLRDGKVLFEGKLPDNMTKNVPLPPRQQNGQAARQQPGIANQQPETTTVVGTIRHVELEGGFWTIETRNGKKLVLGGG